MGSQISKGIKRIVISLCISMLIIPWTSISAHAAESEVKVVRVGWYKSDMFQEGTSDKQEKSGYSYDYLQNVADYTKWKYEYVYGDWTKLYHMLEKGEIDFLAGVSKTVEREKTMLFPDEEMGNDQYYIYKHDYDTSISATDLSTLNGKIIGGIRDNRTTELTEEWIRENDLNIQMVYYDSFSALEKAFKKGDINLYTQTVNNVLHTDGVSSVAKVGEEPFYVAVNKNRPDLVEEFNSAVSCMISANPLVISDMQHENYGATITSKVLSEEEQSWLKKNPTITVGYLDDYLPYCDLNDRGEVTGVLVDVMDEMMKSLTLSNDIDIKYQVYSNYEDMTSALGDKKIDVAFPVSGSLWDLEQSGIDASAAVMTGTETLFYTGEYTPGSIKSIAVNKNNSMQIAYSKKNFAGAYMLEYNSIEECLDAVKERKADGTVVNTMRIALVTNNSKYNKLSYIQLPAEEKRCFGVNASETELLLILNRGLGFVGSSYGIENSYKYMSGLYKITAIDFIRSNILQFAFIAMSLVAVALFTLIVNLNEKDKRNKELEKLKEAAEEADKAKTAFLFNMSHDIRTPMNAILGYTELMQRQFDDKEACRGYLAKVKHSGNFLLSLINNVLEMARIESGKEELNETVCSLEKVLEEITSVYSELMSEKGINFTYEADIVSDYVYADVVKLDEIFLNLLSNAYKYTPQGGSVTFSVKELPGKQVGYSLFEAVVSDTGKGMKKEFLETIFEPFSREKSATQSGVTGSGLGMPIVKNLIELMGGTITVESEPGKGTTFVVRASHKIADGTAEAIDKSAELDYSSFSGKRILLAEDNELNAEIAMTILNEVGFEVELAEDGEICVDMLSSKEVGYYDLILMDVQMPNMNGYEATRAIRKMEDPGYSLIPIIALTANAFKTDKEDALKAGMNAHLSKPIIIDEMMETLTKILKEAK